MATKTVAWNSGSGVITLTYTGQGNGSVSVKSDVNDSFDERSQNLNIVTTDGSPERAVQILVKQKGKSLGWTTKDFGYTGSVQEVILPKGRYKLQCWGAQGGNVTGTYAATGSKGGYSEGVITLTETTTLYVFVGGQGESYTSSTSQTSTSIVNGGWNGGGAGVRTARYDSSDHLGISFPRGGGGATDIALVSSTMTYSSGRTDRSSTSLLSRFIVAGGGGGASSSYTRKTSYDTTEETIFDTTEASQIVSGSISWLAHDEYIGDYRGSNVHFVMETEGEVTNCQLVFYDVNNSSVVSRKDVNGSSIDWDVYVPDNAYYIRFQAVNANSSTPPTLMRSICYIYDTTSSEEEYERIGNTYKPGGGVTGGGSYPGTQSGSYGNGAFGLGGSQQTTNYRYCCGGGGGGWYGGRGNSYNDNDDSYIDYNGGGSGFVNTAANASYRPSGYTGLQLDSGSTTAGSSSHPSVSGGTEVGHSGNGYARITVIS